MNFNRKGEVFSFESSVFIDAKRSLVEDNAPRLRLDSSEKRGQEEHHEEETDAPS